MLAGNIGEMFPDWDSVECGNWSSHVYTFKYGDGATEYLEIGLYREPMDNTEYAGTYTLQAFDRDAVIVCHTVG